MAASSALANDSGSPCNRKREDRGDRRRRAVRLANTGSKTVLARIGQADRHPRPPPRQQRNAQPRALHDRAVRKRSQRGNLCGKAHRQDDSAIGAEPAVAHDLQFGCGVGVPPRTVGDVGQTVLMRRAGQQRATPSASAAAARSSTPACRNREQKHQPDSSTDHRTDDRKHPVRAHRICGFAPCGCGIGSAGSGRRPRFEIVEPFIHGGARKEIVLKLLVSGRFLPRTGLRRQKTP